jgi:hypothetical protein
VSRCSTCAGVVVPAQTRCSTHAVFAVPVQGQAYGYDADTCSTHADFVPVQVYVYDGDDTDYANFLQTLHCMVCGGDDNEEHLLICDGEPMFVITFSS